MAIENKAEAVAAVKAASKALAELGVWLGANGQPGPVEPKITRLQRLIDSRLGGQGEAILYAAKAKGLDIADACALVEQESQGENVFGHDHGPTGDAPPYYGHAVTPIRLQRLISQPGYKDGRAKMNGVGITQLTYYVFVLRANALPGGATRPINQCLVGFELLAGYLRKYDRLRAFAVYNAGDVPKWGAGIPYSREVQAKADAWRQRIAALDEDGGGGGELLAHGVRDGTNFAAGHKKLMALVGKMRYEIWYSGDVPAGPMAWAANAPLPTAAEMAGETCACMGVGNIYRRAAGKIVPTRGNPRYDGGVAAYWYTDAFGGLGPGFFSGVNQPFNMTIAKSWARETESGVLIGRRYRSATLAGQGHIAILLPDGKVMQSFLFGNDGTPGLNDDHTIEQSHAGGYYELMVHPMDWINHDLNNF